jgi:hypothetical protein
LGDSDTFAHRTSIEMAMDDDETTELVNLPGYPMTQLLFENRRSIVMRATNVATGQKCVIKLLKAVGPSEQSEHEEQMAADPHPTLTTVPFHVICV